MPDSAHVSQKSSFVEASPELKAKAGDLKARYAHHVKRWAEGGETKLGKSTRRKIPSGKAVPSTSVGSWMIFTSLQPHLRLLPMRVCIGMIHEIVGLQDS
jgi:hypothetical protein